MREDGRVGALVRLCTELNFKNSVAEDAYQLRARVVDVLSESAGILDTVASSLRQRAEDCRSSDDRVLLLRNADRAGIQADSGRRRAEKLAAKAIEAPRPASRP
ncbi:hypothetical protein LQ327_23115 [Actinomycetospora endophytica]|uniref:ANTAR domain-containing protein n=1 Tax=Actinomycetospora endophytica TaxID=2291215 RepID=A0ABS8PDB7_9PSEU|nr:hypothetical protein [Actinomycetospora endophytica]MCD2196270.1 hypothetical protein [Actinomycetospora endophytica]